ncbi:MAG: nuclear transport factor 2 family protein [Sphingobacteriaceae bacterium]|nr:MAG: nuclear transport factor 2 family protein [Sphingobacteriaceae bacterium]
MQIIVKIRICICLAVLLFITNKTLAQSNEHQAIAAAVDELRADMIGANVKALQELLSDSLVYGHSGGGQAQTKAQFIESLSSGSSVFKTITFTQQSITVKNNTAIVTHLLSADTDDKGKGSKSIKLWVMLTWIKENNGWKLLARQSVKMN